MVQSVFKSPVAPIPTGQVVEELQHDVDVRLWHYNPARLTKAIATWGAGPSAPIDEYLNRVRREG